MPTEEEKITLVMEADYLPSSELGQRRKEGAEKSADGVAKQSREALQIEFGCPRPSVQILFYLVSGAHKSHENEVMVWHDPMDCVSLGLERG